MDYTRPLGLLCALAVALSVVGALVSLVTGPLLDASVQMRAAIVVALVAVSVLAMVVVGTRGSGEWLANGGYW
jgi:MFS-type transporter involved in bile tolerance (Atg22 family)